MDLTTGVYELENQLLIAGRLQYVEESSLAEVLARSAEDGKMVTRSIRLKDDSRITA